MDRTYFDRYFDGSVDDSYYGTAAIGEMVPISVYQADAKDQNKTGSFDQVQSLMQNITDSMTAYMRSHGNTNLSSPALGSTYHDTTCVHVRWAWLAYDGIFVVLTVVSELSKVDSNTSRMIVSEDVVLTVVVVVLTTSFEVCRIYSSISLKTTCVSLCWCLKNDQHFLKTIRDTVSIPNAFMHTATSPLTNQA